MVQRDMFLGTNRSCHNDMTLTLCPITANCRPIITNCNNHTKNNAQHPKPCRKQGLGCCIYAHRLYSFQLKKQSSEPVFGNFSSKILYVVRQSEQKEFGFNIRFSSAQKSSGPVIMLQNAKDSLSPYASVHSQLCVRRFSFVRGRATALSLHYQI